MSVEVDKDVLEDVLEALGASRDFFQAWDTAASIAALKDLVQYQPLTIKLDEQVEILSAILNPYG